MGGGGDIGGVSGSGINSTKRWIPRGTLLVANLRYLLIHWGHTVSQICWPHWGSWCQRVVNSAANIIHKNVYYNECRIMLPSLPVFERVFTRSWALDWPFQVLYFYFLCNWIKFNSTKLCTWMFMLFTWFEIGNSSSPNSYPL